MLRRSHVDIVTVTGNRAHLSGLNLGNIQDRIDQRQQVMTGGMNLAKIGNVVLVPIFFRLLLQHFAVADNGVEWRPQLMAHVGQKRRLCTIASTSLKRVR